MNHGHSSHPKVTRDIQRERDPFRGGMIHCHDISSHVHCHDISSQRWHDSLSRYIFTCAGRHCLCIYVLGDGKNCP